MSKTIVEITPKGNSSVYIQFKGKPKPISGHRFTALLGLESKNMTKTEILFDLFGIRFQAETRIMLLGKIMEAPCINYMYGDEIYLTYSFNEYSGNALDLENKNDINGLPDAILPEYGLLVENKVTTRYVTCQEKWKKQAQFYAYWWNKLRKDDTGIEIKKVQVLRYFVNEDNLDWQLNNPYRIIEDNIETYDFDLETEQIEKDMEVVRQRKEELCATKFELRKNYSRFIRWLALGSVRGLIKFKVNQDIPICKEYMNMINKYVKEYKKG